MVQLLPTSARRRRRVVRLLLALAVVGVGALVAVLVPNYSGHTTQHFTDEPAQLVKAEHELPVAAADRRSINALLDRFVPAAVGRRDPGAAYDLATPALRAGEPRATWLRGDLPVVPLRVGDSTFHGWSVEFSLRNEVSLDLLVHAKKGEDVSAIAYSVDVKRLEGRWLVDSMVLRQAYAPTGSPASAAPTRRAAPAAASVEEHRAMVWLLAPLAVVLVPLLVLTGFAVLRWRRNRLAEQRYRAAG